MFQKNESLSEIIRVKRQIDILVTDYCTLDVEMRQKYQRSEDKIEAISLCEELSELAMGTQMEYLVSLFCQRVRIYANSENPSARSCTSLFAASRKIQLKLDSSDLQTAV